ncbi:MAG: hypothetical protein AB1458_14065 [Bacteroidota bacterium]
MRALKQFTDLILYSNVFISLCAAAASYETFLLAGRAEHPYLIFVFCSTFVFYNGQRILLARDHESPGSSERHKWIARHIRLLALLCVIAFSAAFPLAMKWDWDLIVLFGLFSFLASLYFIPGISLRAVPGLKAAYVSLLWAFSTVVFPLMLIKGHPVYSFPGAFGYLLALERFFFLFALCIVFNIRDMEYDRGTGVRTIPILFGTRATRLLAALMMLVFAGLVIYRSYFSDTGLQAYAPALLVSAALSLFVLFATNEKRGEYYYILVIDGMILLQAILVFSTEVFS